MNTEALAITQQSLRDAGVLVLTPDFNEAEILDVLEQHISKLLSDTSSFMQTMYRLDIDEQLVLQALQQEDHARLLAEIIFRRQWQKALARLATPPPPPDADEDLLL